MYIRDIFVQDVHEISSSELLFSGILTFDIDESLFGYEHKHDRGSHIRVKNWVF